MKIKFIIILIFSVCFISCANTNKAKDAPEMIGFQYIVDKYFNSYEAILNPAVIRPRNSLATIHIPKKSLSKVEMNLI